MSPPHDLIERLAAADPLPDVETLTPEQRRESDVLLERLLATTVEARRRRRRWPRVVVAGALGAVAVLAALSLLDSDEGSAPNVVAKAVAALTQPDAVYHAEVIPSLRSTEFPEPSPNIFFETWHTTTGRLHWRTYVAKKGGRGRLLSDFAGQRRPGRLGGPALTYEARTNLIYESGFGRAPSGGGAPGVDPFNPGSGLKELQAEGRLKFAGEVDVAGRRGFRLVSGAVKGSDGSIQRSQIIVDEETYLPLEQRLFVRAPNGETTRVGWRYVKYERLPLNEATSKLLDFDPPPGARCRPGTEHLNRKGALGFPNPCGR